jgi:excinuclease UvrABC helicase subunit UvrB
MFAKYKNLQDFMQGNDFTPQKPAFLEHLLDKLDEHIAKNGKVLLLTLTKKSSEEVTSFLVSK